MGKGADDRGRLIRSWRHLLFAHRPTPPPGTRQKVRLVAARIQSARAPAPRSGPVPALRTEAREGYTSAVGLGGGHYMPRGQRPRRAITGLMHRSKFR